MATLHEALVTRILRRHACGEDGRAELRWLSDEELYRLRLYWWRRHVTLGDELRGLLAERPPEVALRVALSLDTLIAGIRGALDDEERWRERARARGVPRDGGRDWIPDEVVAEVKARVRLAELVPRYTGAQLRAPRGPRQRQWARCPFHDEQTPSFCIWVDDQGDEHWQCFGSCATGGDAISFAQRALGVGFREAVEGLASTCGVDWPPARTAPRRATAPDYLALLREDAS